MNLSVNKEKALCLYVINNRSQITDLALHFTLVFIYYVPRNYRVEQEEHQSALSDILSYQPEGGCCAPVFMHPRWGLPSLTMTGRQNIRPNSFNQATEGRPVHSITMQSLGSTPLLPLIKRALQWKIHLAQVRCLFSNKHFVHTDMHFSFLHSYLFVYFLHNFTH